MTTPGAGSARRVIDVHCGWGSTPTAPKWNDLATLRNNLGSRGIGQAFVSSLLARRYDLSAGNDALAGTLSEQTAGNGADLRGWLVIHPAQLAESNAGMRRHLFSDKFIGAALYPDPITGSHVAMRDVTDVINSFRRYSKPLLVEARTAEAMSQVVTLAESLGSIRVIASGMGGEEWREAVAMATKPLNLFFDISGALVPEKIEYAMEILGGSRKLVYASNAPYTEPAAILGMMDDVALSADDRERILYGNAARLFHLDSGESAAISLTPIVQQPG